MMDGWTAVEQFNTADGRRDGRIFQYECVGYVRGRDFKL
jgi:hypothetical protein